MVRCHHGPQGKCINCMPIEPYDIDYLTKRDPPIKFISFNAYIKKLQSGIDKYFILMKQFYLRLNELCF